MKDAIALLRAAFSGATSIATLIVLVILWEIVCRVFTIPSFLLPRPTAIFEAGINFGLANWWDNIAHTLGVVLAGFFISLVFSLPLAALLVRSPFLNRTIVPLLVVVQSTPIAAVAPLIVVALGAGNGSRILITVLITFFPIVVSATAGLRETPDELVELSRSLDAPTSRQFLDIRFPYALPHIFAAAKVAITLAVIGAVLAEFVASQSGLGYLLLNSAAMFKVPLAYACLIVLISISLLAYALITLIQARFLGWTR